MTWQDWRVSDVTLTVMVRMLRPSEGCNTSTSSRVLVVLQQAAVLYLLQSIACSL
jgi:hypothetical protein